MVNRLAAITAALLMPVAFDGALIAKSFEVVFQSDREVAFDFVAKAMASVQSVGITKVGIVTSGYEN